eukprot:g14092.t1
MLSACGALLVLHALGSSNSATAFMLPVGTCETYNGERRSAFGRSSAAMRFLGGDTSSRRRKGGLFSRVRTTSPVSSSAAEADTSPEGSISSSRSSTSGKSAPEPVVYAQEALDRAWRSKRRIAAQGKSKPLKQRFMDAFGGRSAVFIEDREFMEETLDNVVRVYCTHNMPNWSLPWQRLKQEQSTSTGFVIDGRRIITNAHAVEYSTMIQVRRRGCDRKFQAARFAVGEECDLAILTVDDEEFWKGASPLAFGELPELTDDVNVIGYPVGGECISITAGVVSRVEMTVYAQAEQELLSIQIDAAINPGNSGGPVVNDDGEVVGVAFQSLDGSDVENIGYVVPVNVLEHFLEDVRRHNGKYLGFPRLGITHQHLESPALRGSLRMSPEQTGVMVTGVQPTYPAAKVLRRGDVIMKVDGIRVANDGSIPFRAGERVALKYYMSQLFPEDETEVELLRDDKVMSVTVPLSISDFLCPVHFDGRAPSYFVLGGLVFTVMSAPYLENEMGEGAGGLAHLLSTAEHGVRSSDDQEIVILTQVLTHEVNVGYEDFSNMQLLAFNGERVKSLRHLVRLADESKEEFLRFDLFRDRLVVLQAAGVAEATTQICEDNSIPSPRSADLVDTVAATAAVAAGIAHEPPPPPPPPPLAGVKLGMPGEAEADAQDDAEERDLGQQQQQQQQQPTTGVNGGQPHQPSIARAAVPARGKREPQQQSGRGAAGEGRPAEPRRARWKSAAATALGRVGTSAPMRTGGLRIEEGARSCRRWLPGAKRGGDRGGVEAGKRDRRQRRGATGRRRLD